MSLARAVVAPGTEGRSEVTRRSGVRIKTPFEIALDLEVLVLSSNATHGRIAASAAPLALGVTRFDDDELVRERLRRHPVVCAILVDGALPDHHRDRLSRAVLSRWAHLPVHHTMPSRAPRPEAARARSFSLETDPEWHREDTVRAFLREALDERLRWVAGLLTFAYGHGLTGATLETFVAFAIRQVRRDELARHFNVSEAAVEKRLRELCRQVGCDKVTHLAQVLVTIPPLRTSRAIVGMLEEQAERLRGAGKENPTKKIQ